MEKGLNCQLQLKKKGMLVINYLRIP
uniref:Uncharacterized protein n=1 Tax=Rhizophora mucronata TaxID=61149 RepID=A0A2P2N6R7_RHIMU